jgi:hypothetical protein
MKQSQYGSHLVKQATFTYAYSVGGVAYGSSQLFSNSSSGLIAMDGISEGQQKDVFYNPTDPSTSFLVPPLHFYGLLLFLLPGTIFLLGSLVNFVFYHRLQSV